MITEQLKELAAAKTRVAQLEKAIADERQTDLREVPARYGFDSVDAFVSALRAASGKRRGRKPGVRNSTAVKTASGKRRKRAKITDDTRAEVKKLVETGKTGPEIAKAVGISEQSVFNVKKSLGLVKKRK